MLLKWSSRCHVAAFDSLPHGAIGWSVVLIVAFPGYTHFLVLKIFVFLPCDMDPGAFTIYRLWLPFQMEDPHKFGGSVVVDFLFIVTPIVGVCNCSMFYCMLLDVHSSIAIILMGKRELVALLFFLVSRDG